MLSKQSLKLLYFGLLLISSANAAGSAEEEKKPEEKKEDKKDVTLDVTATSHDNVTFDSTNANDVVLTCKEGFRFKTLKVGDKTLYTVDTGKYTPTKAHQLKHADDHFFRLNLEAAKPLLFKKKSDKEWNEYKFDEYLDKVVWKEKKDAKEVDASKFSDTALFTSDTFGSGKVHKFKGDHKVSKVMWDKKAVGDPSKAKYTDVVVYEGPDDKRLVRLDYFYVGDGRFKETYFKLVDDKWKKLEQSEANKDLHALNPEWSLDYKPVVDKFSPLAAITSVVIAAFAVLYYL
uniref:Major piroplasm surface protein n=3 Tax=unclassified Theileria TaxID=203686 RepID=A0A2Z5WBH4_9APIC|nr:major piroplasm surface protein [Theileria sp. NY-2017]